MKMRLAFRFCAALCFVLACSSSGAESAPSAPRCTVDMSGDAGYPQPSNDLALGSALPSLSFATDDPLGRAIRLQDYYEPCAPRSRLLMIRVSAGWCGTCRWHAAHTGEIRARLFGERLRVIDLVVADDDNLPAAKEDATKWRARIDAPDAVGIDPRHQLQPLDPSHRPLPLIVLVDTRTMKVVNTLGNPDPDTLDLRIRQELALLDGEPMPEASSLERIDGLFSRNQWDMVCDMTLPTSPPPDPTNAHADDPAAQSFGRLLFADPFLSPSGKVSCATCHDPGQNFADGRPQSIGVATVDRNAPSVALAAYSRWQFWDGRADTLWMQALGPLENAKEMDSSRLFVAHAVFDRYKSPYEAVFGALPPLADMGRFPAAGKPDEPTWKAMTADDQKAATRVFVNVGKAIAAFERSLRIKSNSLDAYVAGDVSALTPEQKTGLNTFFVAGCAQCHYGPRLTDDAFHVVRFPTGRQDSAPDRGRVDGIDPLVKGEFNAASQYSDSRSAGDWLPWLAERKREGEQQMLGAFKTPSLRGVSSTGPYGHGGSLPTLADVVKTYSTGGLDPSDPRTVGSSEPWVSNFADHHRAPLEAFLRVLSAPIAP